LVLNGGSSFRERHAVIGGLVSLSSQSAVDATGRALIDLARQARISRELEALDEIVAAILALPLDQRLHAVANYYGASALRKSGDSEQTRSVLEKLVDTVAAEYRPRTLIGLGICYVTGGDLEESARIYLEAVRSATLTDPLSKAQALRSIAVIRSIKGDHEGSLADLERLFPVMRSFATSYPEDYRYYLNNLAYELGQVGRIDEAKAAINVALRSPYADRFPDWAETAQELETMRPRVFLPLVFALGALGSPQSSAPAQPESQPDVQISTARRIAPSPKRNQTDRLKAALRTPCKTSILVVLALATCRRFVRPTPQRQGLKPTFETTGCAHFPPARAPPFHDFLFF
jgi:tetratricopeptide (TPR) repeat protein